MVTLLTEQWVVRKDSSLPWEYHDVPLGTKPKLVRRGFEALYKYGTAFEMHPVAPLPKDINGRTVLPGDKIVYMWGYRSKELSEGVVHEVGKNCLYVMHGANPTAIPHYAGYRSRIKTGALDHAIMAYVVIVFFAVSLLDRKLKNLEAVALATGMATLLMLTKETLNGNATD